MAGETSCFWSFDWFDQTRDICSELSSCGFNFVAGDWHGRPGFVRRLVILHFGAPHDAAFVRALLSRMLGVFHVKVWPSSASGLDGLRCAPGAVCHDWAADSVSGLVDLLDWGRL